MTEPDSDFGLDSIGQVLVPTADLERATGFYRDVLGIRLLFEVPRMAFFDLGGARLMLAEPEDEDRPSGSVLYYRVDDLHAAHETLSARGVSFDAAPAMIADMGDHELWMAFFRDSEGNQLALMSEVPSG